MQQNDFGRQCRLRSSTPIVNSSFGLYFDGCEELGLSSSKPFGNETLGMEGDAVSGSAIRREFKETGWTNGSRDGPNGSRFQQLFFSNTTGDQIDASLIFIMSFFLLFAFCFLSILYIFGKILVKGFRRRNRRRLNPNEFSLLSSISADDPKSLFESNMDKWSSKENNSLSQKSFELSGQRSRHASPHDHTIHHSNASPKPRRGSTHSFGEFGDFEQLSQTKNQKRTRNASISTPENRNVLIFPSFHVNPATLKETQESIVNRINLKLSNKIKMVNREMNKSVSNFTGLPAVENGRFENSFTDIVEIGQGSYGAVFKSRHKLENRTYAIKKINFSVPKGRNPRMERLFREVEAMLNLEHRHIVRYITSWIETDDSSASENGRSSGFEDGTQNPTMNFNKKPAQDVYTETSLVDGLKHVELRTENLNGDSKQQQILLKRSSSESPTEEIKIDNLGGNEFGLDICFGSPDGSNAQLTNSRHNSKTDLNLPNSSFSRSHSQQQKRHSLNPISPKESLILFIQMEYCKGASLLSYIRRPDFRFSDSEIFGIFTQVIEGLCYIHKKKTVHRDLKPGNILFDEQGTLKICDFGLAIKMLDAGDMPLNPSGDQSRLDETVYAGTPLYSPLDMSTEGGAEFDYKMDIYSLGVILFELLSHFKTDGEKIAGIRALKENGRTNADFKQKYTFRANIVEKLISGQKANRPDAEDIKLLDEFKQWEAEVVERFKEESNSELETA